MYYERLLNKAVRHECKCLEQDFHKAKEVAKNTKTGIVAGFNFNEYTDAYNFNFELWKRFKSRIKTKKLYLKARKMAK